ncbi:methyltransferase small domain protein [Dictyocaulus viviparus]|uniref:Methyltransferase HEMK2 n=1 Tax=Dictyocaulus viviparus TaxID=29172 RepID=A0A0D8Y014_DICVI|nr:methyltransferase small domain protein [Dictyocaulus viviparus]
MSLPTPLYKLNAVQQKSVYEPSEDTFLLLDAIEKDIQWLRSLQPQIILEIGCGSGIVSAFLNQAIGGNVTSFATDYNQHALECTMETGRLNGVKIEVIQADLDNGLEHLEAIGGNVTSFATDYNQHALECTMETGRLNGVKIEVIQADLDNGLEHLENKVDILLFNPPYVPTESEPSNVLERCWAGGANGREVVDRLLPRVSRLLSNKGVFYLVALHSNDIPNLLKSCPDLEGTVTMERRCGIEHLYIIKYKRK